MEKANDPSAANGTHDDGDQPEDDPMVNMDDEAAAKAKLNAECDPNKIKFTTVSLMDGKNGEAKVDIHLVQTSVGMSKEELMKFANEPFWIRFRMFLFVLFWVGWLAMLVGAVIIILVAPRCPPAPKLDWYQKTAMYQVDVSAFADSDGSGSGDFKGLISKLEYFNTINVKTLLLNAFYALAPNGIDIVNHTEIDSKFGTMADFTELVEEMKKRDMQVILDFNPNHSSKEHPWFKASVKDQEPYNNFYIWASDEKLGGPPNNWLNVYGDSAWEWNEEKGNYYFHSYGKSSADLNLRNKFVREELENILKFWLDKGVDGFKIVSASHLFEDSGLRDEPLNTDKKVDKPQYSDLNHIYTLDSLENVELFTEWRELMNNFSDTTGMRKILLAEMSGHVNTSVPYYGNDSNPLIDFPINTELTKLKENSSALDLKDQMEKWIQSTEKYMWPNWLLGSRRSKRLADRVGPELIDGLHMVAGLSRGTPISFFGDEIGMRAIQFPDVHVPFVLNRMLWTNDTASEFIRSKLDRTLPPAYHSINVQDEQSKKNSHLSVFSKVMELRKQPAISFGIQEFPLVDEEVFSLMRIRKGSPAYIVAMNMGVNSTVVNFEGKSSHLPESGHVEIRSTNIKSGPMAEGDHPKVKLNNIPLGPKQAVVLSFVPKFEN